MIYMTVFYALALSLAGCDKNYEDTGLADGVHDCSMLEYMENDRSNNWDSAVVAIRYCNLADIFNGTNPEYKDGITFTGFTNFSVSKYLFENGYKRITDIPAGICSDMVLSHVVKGRYMQEDFDYEIKGTLDGGTKLPNLVGDTLRLYRIKTPFMGTPDIGAEKMGVHSKKYGHMAVVASCNIQTTNGIVHSLRSTYVWAKL